MTSLSLHSPVVCATYERVSRQFQAQRGFSLYAQAQSLEEYAAQHGWLLPDDLRFRDGADADASGADWNLPGLQAMLEAARQRRFQVLLVWDLDRFARSLTKALVLEEQLKRYGVRVHYVRVPVDDTPEGRLLKHQLFSFAEYEREKIRLRSVMGQRAKAERGGILSGGRPAYGYRYIPGESRYEIEPQEAAVVERIFRLIGIERRSTHAVARLLTEEGVPTPSQRRQLNYTTFAVNGVWHDTTIRQMIRNPLYKGQWVFGRTKRVKTEAETITTRPVAPEHWIVAPAPAIVTPELWQIANEALDMGKARAQRNSKRFDYLLRGLITCACGRILVGSFNQSHKRYYRCPTRSGSAWFDTCPVAPWYPADWLEEAVWQAVTAPLHDRDLLRAAIADQRARVAAERERITDRLQAVEAALADVQRRLSQLLDQALDGFPAEVIAAKRRELGHQYQALTTERERLLGELGTLDVPDEETLIEALTHDVALGVNAATPDERRALLELLRVRVTVLDNERVQLDWLLSSTVLTSLAQSGRHRWRRERPRPRRGKRRSRLESAA
ncbi:recombinase family protein [Thermorudis peleae]|uniref:recombinase family protein n=1 Tax=Thermorudis peleae TaxID=1382356 RepID=UPI0009DF1727|nr:recombinase family protein [Thermorudis peleae]